MTVIAYSSKHQIIASDSRCVDMNSVHCTNAKKLYRLANGAVLGVAGNVDTRDVRDLLGRATWKKMPSRHQLAELKTSFEGMIVFPRGMIFTVEIEHEEFDHEGEWTAGVTLMTDPYVAIGSGYQLAYGALEAGASPIQAVRAACRRDTACALPVQWERAGPKPRAK